MLPPQAVIRNPDGSLEWEAGYNRKAQASSASVAQGRGALQQRKSAEGVRSAKAPKVQAAAVEAQLASAAVGAAALAVAEPEAAPAASAGVAVAERPVQVGRMLVVDACWPPDGYLVRSCMRGCLMGGPAVPPSRWEIAPGNEGFMGCMRQQLPSLGALNNPTQPVT